MQTVKPKSYSFKERLEFSEEGEILCIEFLNAFSETFKENCIVTSNQNESNYRTCTDAHLMNNPDIKIEFKIDSYKSMNHYIERYSQVYKDGRKKIGGPWQYLDKAEYYIVYYIQLKSIYIFKMKDLHKKMEELIADGTLDGQESFVRQSHADYQSMGYKVHKSLLKDIEYEFLSIDMNESFFTTTGDRRQIDF